ncbi:uncharacterized protein LOC127708496 [Mytilus californianus]|uniref:uncharacterized protein LOC127708496 n=1 Tax=Mytilus californianus TaxID=6549 RepID=UPI0022479C67|nr:uncharacterized protein LOC127708496 [Mytilus californianus]
MGICGDASTWAKVAAILELIGLPLFISGYATPAWMVSETIRELLDVSIGLWQTNDCSSGSCKTSSVPDSYKNGSFLGTQALESLAMVGYILATIFIVIYVATEKARTRCFAITIMTFSLASTFFCVIGMIIWLVEIPTSYFGSWSLGLTIVAAALYVVASCLLIRDLRAQKKANILKVKPQEKVPPIPLQPTYYIRNPSPRYERKALPPPSPTYTPRTPRSVRIDVISPAFTDNSNRSQRRYGTPQYSQRYDYKAR